MGVGGGGVLALKRKKREEKKKKSDRHAITASDMFRLIQAPLSYLLRQFSIRAREVVFGPRRVFDEDIFDLPTSLSLLLATSHKPEAFRPPLTAMTIAAANLAKVLMELTSGGRRRLSRSLDGAEIWQESRVTAAMCR